MHLKATTFTPISKLDPWPGKSQGPFSCGVRLVSHLPSGLRIILPNLGPRDTKLHSSLTCRVPLWVGASGKSPVPSTHKLTDLTSSKRGGFEGPERKKSNRLLGVFLDFWFVSNKVREETSCSFSRWFWEAIKVISLMTRSKETSL